MVKVVSENVERLELFLYGRSEEPFTDMGERLAGLKISKTL